MHGDMAQGQLRDLPAAASSQAPEYTRSAPMLVTPGASHHSFVSRTGLFPCKDHGASPQYSESIVMYGCPEPFPNQPMQIPGQHRAVKLQVFAVIGRRNAKVSTATDDVSSHILS